MIKAILLDFNGVVIDDEPVQMRAYQEILKQEGIDLSEGQYYDCLGKNDEVFLRTIFEGAGKHLPEARTAELIEAKTAGWLKIVDGGVPLFEGIEDFIKRMSNSFALGLVSMARRPEIDHILTSTGLERYFAVVLSAEDVSTVKPDPECYREGFLRIDRARTENGANPMTRRQCVVIEDAPQGIAAGKKARLKTLGVTNTVGADALRKAGADAVTHTLKDWNADSFHRVFD